MGSDSGKDSGQEKSGPSFFDNLAEDFGNIVSGNVSSPHSAYDVRNADAMADKYGRDPTDLNRSNDWLPGGVYGPGSGSYSPSEFHNAGIEKQDGLGSKSLDNTQNATDVSGPSRAVQSLLKEDAPTGLSTPSLSPTIDDSVGPLGLNKTKDVSKVQSALVSEGDLDEQTGYIGTKTVDATKAFQDKKGLKVDGQINPGGPTERALLGTRPEVTSPYSRAPSGTPSIERQAKTWAASQQRQQQAKQEPPSSYLSNTAITFTDNWAKDLIGGRAAATATPKDDLLGRTPDQKAADVGEQPMASQTSSTTPDVIKETQKQNGPKVNKPHRRGRGVFKAPPQTAQTDWRLGWDAFSQKVTNTALDGAAGITATVGAPFGIGVNWGDYDRYKSYADGLVSEEDAQKTEAKIGSGIGTAVSSVAELGLFGGASVDAGQKAAAAARQGKSRAAQARAGFGQYALGATVDRLAKIGTAATRLTKGLTKSTNLLDNTFGAIEAGGSSLLGAGIDLLAEKADRKHSGTPKR